MTLPIVQKAIITTIDYQGNVQVDFSGYVGNECIREEEQLRRGLAALGLQLDTKARAGNRDETALPLRHRVRS